MRDGRPYLRFVSDLWTTVFADSGSLSALVGVEADILSRIYLQAVQVASINFADDINVFREDFWHIVSIRSDQRVETSDPTLFRYPLGRPYERIPFLYNKIFEPTFRMMDGVDYSLETDWAEGSDAVRAGFITFKSDPFANSLVPRRVVGRTESNEDVYELAFFAPRVMIDEADIWRTWGHLVNVFQPSSENYRQLVYGILYIYMHGPVIHPLNAGLNLACGYPVARDNEEVLSVSVVSETISGGHYLVQTSANVYRVPFRNYDRLGQLHRVPSLSVVGRDGDQPGTMLRPLDTFTNDIQVVDWLTPGYEEWWKGDGTNRVVNFLPPEMAPEIDFLLRDDVDVIDHLFESFFKYATFAANINTLAIGNFNAVDDFFEVLYDVKPAYTAPYANAFFDPKEQVQEGDGTTRDLFQYEDRHAAEGMLPGESRQGRFGWGDHERPIGDAGEVREGVEAEVELDEQYRGNLKIFLGAMTPVFADLTDLYNPDGLTYIHKDSTYDRLRFTNDLSQAQFVHKFKLGIKREQFRPHDDTSRDHSVVDAEINAGDRYGWMGGKIGDRYNLIGDRIVLGSAVKIGSRPEGHLVEGIAMDASFEIEDTVAAPVDGAAPSMIFLEDVFLEAPVVTGTIVSYIDAPEISGELDY